MALPPSLDESSQAGRNRRRTWIRVLRVSLALAVSLLIFQIKLDYFEAWLYDLRVRVRPAPPLSGQIELILIDRESLSLSKGNPSFREHAQVLRQLLGAEPRAVVYDLRFDEIPGGDVEKMDFAETAGQDPRVLVVTEELLEMKEGEGRRSLPPPFERLRLVPGPKSKDSNNFARDGVTRRFLLEYEGVRAFHLQLAGDIRPELGVPEMVRGQFDFLGAKQAYINFRPTGSYPALKFSELLRGEAPPKERLQGKILIVGNDTHVSEKDYAQIPYSRSSVAMTSAEVHANILDTLLLENSVIRSPWWVDLFFVLIVSLVTVWVVFAAKPARGLLILGASLLVFIFVGGLAFWPFGFWIGMAHPLLTVFLCYYFLIPYRLIIENRRSWEIYQKHKLLQQLEELKTNFISMMSHDLKTPVARIQGMTEIIEKDTAPLSTSQREALDTIRQSSDDLLKFINSILQYGKIEAQQIQLHLQPKDINSLMKEVVRKHDFLAKIKKIKVIEEYDPLFPIQVDPELLKQVFSNLVENAIKYSPEDTRILISTEENNGLIEVQVADQGPGIPADELPNIFMKFFRSKNAKSSPIKGSGLGLYLAQYFTELHGGRVSVESTYGQGSTFTVKLPLEQRSQRPGDLN